MADVEANLRTLGASKKFAALVGLVVVLLGGIFAVMKLTKKDAPVVSNGDYVAGDKVGGDKVGGDKYVIIAPTDPQAQEIVRSLRDKERPALDTKYPDGHAVVGVTPKGFVVPSGSIPYRSDINIDWSQGKVLSFEPHRIRFVLPDISFGGDRKVLHSVVSLTTETEFHVGDTFSPYRTPEYTLVVEVLGIDKGLITIGLGLRRVT